MMNRSFGYANNNRNNYGWRGSSSSVQDQGSDRKILDLIEKIRSCKPYLQKRLKIIEDSGQTKLLREEVQDITYWLEIAQEVRADLIYGVETLEVVHEKMMDMIRLHPIQGTLSSSRLEHFSDEEDDSAPRSPSPVGSSSDFASTKIIPLESSQSRLEWERSKADFNGLLSTERRPPDRSFDHLRNEPGKFNNSNNEWPSSSGFEYTRRGDTDMRVDPPGRFDAFSNGRTNMPTQRILRDPHLPPPRPFDDPRSSASNSPWVNSNESSPWNNFRNSGPRSQVHNRERGDDSVRDCDYRDRGREPSPDRINRYHHPHQDRRHEDDRGRQFFRDQDFRDISRSNSRDDNRPRDRSHEGNRDVPHEREWSRPSHHEAPRNFRDTRDHDPRRRDFHGDSDNRDQWQQNSHNSGGMSGPFNNGGGSAPTMGMSPNPAPFMMNQNLMGLGRQDMSMLNPPPGHPMNRGMPQQGNNNMNASAVIPPRVAAVGIGPQSPSQFPHGAFGVPPPTRQGLLPTPPRGMAPPGPGPNFGMPFQAPTNPLNSPRPPPPVGLNPFDPRAAAAEFADQFRQKAQQHFASKAPPPRPSAPAPTPPKTPAPSTPAAAAANPNLASNQIVADLPSDPRRRSQLQRMQQQLQKQQQQQSQHQQQKQQQSTSSSAVVPGDPRQQRRASSPTNKEKEINKEKTDEKKIAGAGKTENSAEASQLKTTKRPVPLERPKDAKDSPKRNIQELRKSLAKRGFHVLGTKTKHFEEVEAYHEAEDPAPPPEDSEKDGKQELEDEVKRTDTSPTRNQQAKSTRRSERVTCNKEQQKLSSEDEENDGRRRSARNRKGPEDDKRTKKLSVSEDEEKETPGKNQPKVQKSVDAATPPVKSVAHFRIPKIKRPEPPPPPPPPAPEDEPEEIDLASPPASPPSPSSTSALEIDEDRTETLNNAKEQSKISEPSNVPSATNKEKARLSKTADESIPEKAPAEAKETASPETSSKKSPEKPENVTAGTETLLRLFMAKSVGLSGDILDQIISNPGAMDKIKNLLKDHVSEIVGNDSSSAPAPPDGSSEKAEEKNEVEDDEEVGDECTEAIESPAPQDELPRRGRTMAKKRANKRRSSLEKLHDALREMNFDAVLPLGPRRAVNTRNQEDEEASNSVAESIQSVIDNVVDESNGEDLDLDSSLESENPEPVSAPVKRTPKGKKRQGSAVSRVPRKRNRKSGNGNIVAVTEKAAIAAVAAIPDSEILAQTSQGEHGSQSTSPASETVTCRKRVRKSITKPEVESSATKSPAKNLRPARPLPGPDAEVRITRGMIRAATTTSENTEVPLPEENNKESRLPSSTEAAKSPVKNEDIKPDVSMLDAIIAASPPKPRIRQYKAKKKVVQTQPEPQQQQQEEVQPAVVEEPELPAEIKVEPVEVDTSPYVFEYSEDCGFDPKEQIISHDKLLNDQPGANIFVRKVFPDSFGDFLNSILESDVLEKDGENDKADEEVTCEKLLSECRETLDWMMSMVDFKEHHQAPNTPELDLSDLVDSTEGAPIKMNETFRRIVLLHSDVCEENGKDEDNDDEEDDDEDVEDEGASSSDADQRQGDKALDAKSRDGDAAASDDDGNKSPTISGQESADISPKDDPDERESLAQDEEDRDSDRKKNLEGHDLYRCANLGCGFSAANGALYKDHALNCIHSQDARNLLCFHCERRLKSIQSLMEHLKIHGTARQLCSLCNFRGWFSSELSKHMKTAHKVYNTKVVTEAREDEDPVYIMYPKGVAGKLAQPNDLVQNHILYTSKVQFRPTDLESVPKSCIFPSLAHCALCDYSTKVRSNIIRHLQLHARSEEDGGCTEVPSQAPVNPVPCLERKELMFDKMTNWAGSSHATKIGGVSKEDTLKLPKFVIDQFRYVCSVSSCKQVTGQDDILCTHMKALHSKEKYYVCPHCQEEEGTRDDPRNTVLIERIPHHLKLHGPRLSKCGHCDYIHFASTSMEKHVATKHIEKKPIFYLIRDLDSDGNSLVRRSSVDDPTKGPNERWRCSLCKAQLNCWDEAKSHCSSVHKIEHQFECSACHYGCNSIYTIASHVTKKACKPDKVEPKVMIMFLRNENFETTEAKNDESTNVPIWRRDKPRVKHIRGIFLDDENVRAGTSKATAPKLSATTPTAGTSPAATPAKPPAPAPLLVCPKCNLFKAKTAKDLKVHLFNELNYQRYKCIICDVRCVTVESLKAHMNIDHKAIMEDEEKYLLPVSQKIETQVYDMISAILNTQKSNAEDKDGRNIENLLCKHCYLQFSSYHNYRTHILAKHIGSERFRCKHCNAGFWHEAMVKQHHHKSSHASLPFIVIRDNEFEQMLTPEFWFQEYRIPHNKSLNSAGIGRPEDEFSGTSPSKYSEVTVHGGSGSASPGKKAGVKRRSISTTSDTDKEEEDPLKLTPTPKKCLKHFKELASYYKCEHCLITNFTKRGMRSHWSRSHGMEELPCRYYECKSFDDNLRLNDGYVLKCSTCTFQTSSVEHYQSHHEVDHPGKAFRFKRKKRNELGKNASAESAAIVICNYCYCELESVKKCQNHSVQKHPGRPVEYKTVKVSSSAQRDHDLAGAKLIEDSVVVECPVCSKSCGSLKRYVQHYNATHDDLSYADPLTRFSRCYGITEDADSVVDMEQQQQPPKAKMARRNLMDMEVRSSEPAPVKKPPPPPPSPPPAQPTVLYECPKCDFKSDNLDLLCNRHLITHLLAYRCPECNLAFHLHLDAQFHIRHFHGIPRVRPTHNGEAYVEFSSLKDKITKVDVAPRKNVILVNLSDDEDFDDTPTVYPIPNPGDLDELDVEDVRMLLE